MDDKRVGYQIIEFEARRRPSLEATPNSFAVSEGHNGGPPPDAAIDAPNEDAEVPPEESRTRAIPRAPRKRVRPFLRTCRKSVAHGPIAVRTVGTVANGDRMPGPIASTCLLFGFGGLLSAIFPNLMCAQRRVCVVDQTCLGGEVCAAGFCAASCSQNADCAGGQRCSEHVCATIGPRQLNQSLPLTIPPLGRHHLLLREPQAPVIE